MIPLFHDFEGKRVVVVGGGDVALRKARRFAREADVTVVAPRFVDGFQNLDCELVSDRVTPDDAADLVSNVYLVVAATDDPSVNDAVATAAKAESCLVNRVDTVGDVIVPSSIDTAELTVAFSTHGSSPTVSKYLRKDLTPYMQQADGMVRIQEEIRDELKAAVDDQGQRKELLNAVIEADAVWEHLPENYDCALEEAQRIIGDKNRE
jgi:precorrin-2 dehydrogenase/sirohydrochlorin ferrochelatase